MGLGRGKEEQSMLCDIGSAWAGSACDGRAVLQLRPDSYLLPCSRGMHIPSHIRPLYRVPAARFRYSR